MKRREDGRRKELARESGQTKRGQEKGRERKEREIEKKNMVTDESEKVSVTQSVSSCDAAWPFCKTMFLQIFYLFSYYCVDLYLTDFKDSLILKKKITIHSCSSQVSCLVYVMLFEVLYLDFLNVAMKQLFKKKNP